jgi:hypothetical protein
MTHLRVSPALSSLLSFAGESSGGAFAMTVRLSKIILCLCLAAFAFLVTFGNITDYGSNFAFVQHVLSMDTTFPGNKLM